MTRERAAGPARWTGPAGLTARARPEARPDRRAANLHRLPTAGPGSGRCGTSDSQVPGGPREVRRRRRQEHHRPPDSLRCKGTPHERNGAKADQDDTSGNAHASERAEVAVLEWPDYALHARSRGRCPPPAQTSRSGVVIGSGDIGMPPVSCGVGHPITYQYDITLIDESQERQCKPPWQTVSRPVLADQTRTISHVSLPAAQPDN